MQDIYFDDLANPKFSKLQRFAHWLSDLDSTSFDDESLERAVKKRIGEMPVNLDDVRADLKILQDEYSSDEGLTGAGKAQAFDQLVLCLSNHLLIRDQLAKADSVDLNRNHLVVAGLPRSGTTHLLNLLAADTRFRALPLWIADEPVLPDQAKTATLGLRFTARLLEKLVGTAKSEINDPRYLRCSIKWSLMQLMAPHLAAMHPMNPDHIHEEYGMMGYNFGGSEFEWRTFAPKWRDHYQATDQFRHYEWLKQTLNLLQASDEPTKPWVLKSVQHLERLPELRSIFPEATVVFTHRDPVAVIQSAVTMLTYGQRMQRKKVDTRAMIDYWAGRIEWMLLRSLETRSQWPAEQRHDMLFHEFMSDDLGTIKKIYNTHGIEFDATAQSQMREYIKNHQRGKHGRVRYNLVEQFGVQPEELRERFEFYYNVFPVKFEV